MAEETTGVKPEPDAARVGGAGTNASLTDRMEALEQGIKDTWQGATTAVADAVDGVAASVATTVESVQGTTRALGRAFDLSAHMRRHPWLVAGGAVLLGLVVITLIRRPRR